MDADVNNTLNVTAKGLNLGLCLGIIHLVTIIIVIIGGTGGAGVHLEPAELTSSPQDTHTIVSKPGITHVL